MASEAGIFFWHTDDQLVLFVSGRVTATEAYALYHHLDQWLQDHQQASVFVDLDDTSYIDSTTIGTLIRLHKERAAAGGQLVLCNLSPSVYDIISKTKLTRYFTIIEDDTLHSIEHEYLERMSHPQVGDIDSSFVLDAHNDICAVRPELTEKFEGLLRVLRQQQG